MSNIEYEIICEENKHSKDFKLHNLYEVTIEKLSKINSLFSNDRMK